MNYLICIAVCLFIVLGVDRSVAQEVAQEKALACSSAQHRAFDFWLGEWRVTTAQGEYAGDNKVELLQQGCVIAENWVSAKSPFTGTSYNSFNSDTGQWEQLWLDNQGGRLHLFGGVVNKRMVLESLPKLNAEGKSVHNQIIWSAESNGVVRQLWTVFIDGKKDTIAFDGLYHRVDINSATK